MAKYTEDVSGQQVLSNGSYHSSQDRTIVDRQRNSQDIMEANVRRATAAVNTTNQANPSIARSMSRYRRNRPAQTDPAGAPAVPPTPVLPDRTKIHCVPALPSSAKQILAAEEEKARERHRRNAMAQLTGGVVPVETAPSRTVKTMREDRSGKTGKAPRKDEPATTSTRPVQSGRKQADAARDSSDSNRRSLLQKVGLSKSKPSQDHTKELSTSSPAKPNYIGIGGGGIVPGTDAPVSAVNAGERLVLVKFGEAGAQLPVTPFTQAHDLLQSATKQISRDIDPDTFIVIESFQQIGLERPLRRYERIRDVMNSWALDTDGSLIIVPPSSMEAIAQLDAQSVPAEKPPETTVYCYYSHKPRKWDKRYVTLRADGQVTISKKENSKDTTNICHLSDFDIYSPSARPLAKEIKPPKKICLAIKSQQKSSMFLSTENFVHFFSTNDRAIADKWHKVVQSWRSWYLVNKVGVANPVKPADETDRNGSLMQSATRVMSQPRGVSSDGPRLDRQNSEPESMRRSVEHARKEAVPRRKTTREHRPPPSSFPKSLAIDTDTSQHHTRPALDPSPSENLSDAVFTSSGLLGRTYTQRQQAMREREEREKRANQEPFLGQGLVSGSPMLSPVTQASSRTNTLTQADAAAHLGRTASLNQGQKPLVDLTPVFVEPPQHARKGRGVTVEPGRQLIDAATGPELAPGTVNVPPATAWRRPSTEVSSQSRYRSNTMRSGRQVSAPVQHVGASSAGASPTSPNGPFVANNLLAVSSRNMSSHQGQGQGRATGGHGVATGDRNATRPLLDLSADNPFAEGSLLRQL